METIKRGGLDDIEGLVALLDDCDTAFFRRDDSMRKAFGEIGVAALHPSLFDLPSGSTFTSPRSQR